MLIHPRSVNDKAFQVWPSPGRFTKNPDLIQLPSGRLMLVYSDTDSHWSQVNQVLTILASDDLGRTWYKVSEVDCADLRQGDERFVTPRLSRLRDGRLVVIIDHNDFHHFHEDQSPGNWIYWSEDEGQTWSGPHKPAIGGFEPDRILELPDGRLAVCSHIMRGASQEFAEIMTCSDDDGVTWCEQATIAHDGYHRFCEGALVLLDGGEELACVMRENHSAGIPCFVCFSQDMGKTWSEPQMLPFAIHRPYAKQLADGRVLVTGRHVNGGLGTYAWVGDLHDEAGSYQIGGPRRKYAAELTPEALVIHNKPGHECRYTMLPAESSKSEVLFEAQLRVEGPPNEGVAFLSLSMHRHAVLSIGPNGVWVGPLADLRHEADMTRYRKVTVKHRRGLMCVLVDDELAIDGPVYWDTDFPHDFHGGVPGRRTQFGQLGEQGTSYWKSVRYVVSNPTHEDHTWQWSAENGSWPDEYQRRRMIQVHGNVPEPRPDHGYSSWVVLEDGRIMLVDYTNYGDKPGKSHLVGVHLEPGDIA